jgi:hypothetical protein
METRHCKRVFDIFLGRTTSSRTEQIQEGAVPSSGILVDKKSKKSEFFYKKSAMSRAFRELHGELQRVSTGQRIEFRISQLTGSQAL